MSQSAIDITLPEGWEAAEKPLGGASLQAYEPPGPGFRSSISVHAYVPAEVSDTPPEIDDLHRAQVNDMVFALDSAHELEDVETTVRGLKARVAVVGFRQDEYTVLARVWTIQAFNGVLAVAGLCDAQRVTAVGPLINAAVESLTINVDPEFQDPTRA